MIDQSIAKALAYLEAIQEPDGSFKSFSSADVFVFTPAYTYKTIFTSALILTALSKIETLQTKTICSSAATFLLSQKSDRWTFNYWRRGSKESRQFPYPDDLDDTFATLSALRCYDSSLVDARALAHIVKVLIAQESQIGGPYYTWVAPKEAENWRDIDTIVNANVAYFLNLAARSLPNLTVMMDGAIKNRQFGSPYYPDEYPGLYFIARSYEGRFKEELQDHILHKRQQGTWGTPLRTALALAAVLRLGADSQERAVQYLLRTQKEDGSWSAEAFCLDPKRDGKLFYNGSSALTTALATEALWQSRMASKKIITTGSTGSLEEPKRLIMDRIKKDSKELKGELNRIIIDILYKTAKGKNGNEIMALPFIFYSSLARKPKIQKQLLVDLGAASTYGWMAYTIYDDFLDAEGKPELLSTANSCLRRSIDSFHRALPNAPSFQRVVRQTFDTIDAANTWETIYCRAGVNNGTITLKDLPNFQRLGRLADRSLGHALAPLGVLEACGVSVESDSSQAFLRAFRHYLIARQLNDDIHDWREDLRAGRVTYVLSLVFDSLDIKKGDHSIDALISKAEPLFWHTTLPYVCQRILYHTKAGRRAMDGAGVFTSENAVKELLATIESSVAKTRETMHQAEHFLQAYRAKR